MPAEDDLAARFERSRPRLRTVAHRLLGSSADAEDAVQEAWLRLSRSDETAIANLDGWLTTVVARICLDALRTRAARRELPLDVVAPDGRRSDALPDPVVTAWSGDDPADAAELADAVGAALLVVLQTLAPPERLAFVLHDLFAVPFDQIGPMLDRSADAAKMLASRARSQVRGIDPQSPADLRRQREVLAAFLEASRHGDFEALLAVLDPDVELRADRGVGRLDRVRGAGEVAGRALTFARLGPAVRPVLVNGGFGVLSRVDGVPVAVLSVTVRNDRIVALEVFADAVRLARLPLPQ